MIKKIKFVDFWKNFDSKDNFLQETINDIGYEIELSEEPDYLIYSVFGREFLDEKYDNCVKIFFTGENLCPDFNLCDYAIGFEYLNFGDRYLRYPLYYAYNQELWNAFMSKHCNLAEKLARKSDFCSFVYSNGNADPAREQFFKKLSEYKKVDSGGRYLNNIGKPNGVENKIEFESRHKFSIAFESSSHPGYTTEKLIQSFAANTVPIYWGDPTVKDVFNTDSFVCVNDFESLDAVVDKVKEIDQNDELYLKYLGTPALLEREKLSRERQVEQLGNFLRNIFDQKKEKAFRRNKGCRETYYLAEQRKTFELPSSSERIFSKLRKILRIQKFFR